ncbi:MAG TPA: hypothetical protein VFZ00_28595 [Solirubrobacter sp.]|nr:hypothetical protein [Solirubrobacter sp.]
MAAVAVIAIGLAVTAPAYLTRERDYVAVTPQPPTIEPPTDFTLPAEAAACMDRVALDSHSEQARVRAAARGSSPLPLEVIVTGPDYLEQARFGPRLADGRTVTVDIRPPSRSLVADVCVRNLSSRDIKLEGVGDRARSRSGVAVYANTGDPNDVYVSNVGYVVTFYERRPTSILDRLPVSLERMAVMRPAVVVPATLWVLLVLFLVGVPALAVWAFARALRADEVPEGEPSS